MEDALIPFLPNGQEHVNHDYDDDNDICEEQ